MFFAHRIALTHIQAQTKHWSNNKTLSVAIFLVLAVRQSSHAQELTAQAGSLAKGANQEVSVSFSGPVDRASATEPSNYSVSAGGISDIRFVPLANAAILTVSGLT